MQGLEHIKLRDTPFRMGVTPSEIVAHTSWCEARTRALAVLANGVQRVAVIGQTGSGRTLLLNTLASALAERGRAVRLVDGGRLPADLDSAAVLLVDDADRLDRDAITRCIRRGAPCIFAGPPVLRAMIPPPFAAVKLKPLSSDEVARFVAMRLAAAGRQRDYMQLDAVLALARLSGGVPRQINVLGGSAVFLAELDGAAKVNQQHVEEAALMRDGGDPLPPPMVDEEADELPPALEPSPASPPPPAAPVQLPARKGSFASRVALIATGIAAALLIAAAISSHPWTKVGQPQRVAAAPPLSALPRPQDNTPAPTVSPPAPAAVQQPAPQAAQPAPAQPPAPAPEPQPAAQARALAPAPMPAAPPEAAPAPEQAAAAPRVVLHYRTGDGREADHLATWLAQFDPRFGHVETRQVPSTPRTPSIRFYHPEDVGAAWELRAALSNTGETWQVSNYTRYPQKPRRGTLEIWLP